MGLSEYNMSPFGFWTSILDLWEWMLGIWFWISDHRGCFVSISGHFRQKRKEKTIRYINYPKTNLRLWSGVMRNEMKCELQNRVKP